MTWASFDYSRAEAEGDNFGGTFALRESDGFCNTRLERALPGDVGAEVAAEVGPATPDVKGRGKSYSSVGKKTYRLMMLDGTIRSTISTVSVSTKTTFRINLPSSSVPPSRGGTCN
jgi:hypothetical protein